MEQHFMMPGKERFSWSTSWNPPYGSVGIRVGIVFFSFCPAKPLSEFESMVRFCSKGEYQMPTMTIEEEIVSYGRLLAEITGPEFHGTHKYDGSQLPYRWEFKTTIEPLQFIATIQLTGTDIMEMNGTSDDQKLEYLRTKFAHLFNRS
jgi:hypothetical protein